MVTRRKLSLQHNAEIIEELTRTKTRIPETVSLRKFIDINFDAFANSGKTILEIYDFLKEKNLDVSSFHVFRSLYSKVKTARRRNPALPKRAPVLEELPPKLKEQTQAQAIPEKVQNPLREGYETNARKDSPAQAKVSKYNPALPPVFLPGGVEAWIDPETGAKCFEIK
jgi:hypothetical protein